MARSRLLNVTAAAAVLAAGAAIAADPVARATMQGAEGGQSGEVLIFDAGDRHLIRVSMSGLEPGWHGFHIHETGDCGDDFEAAGDHFAPEGREHGVLSEGPAHAGDLPNIHADAQGEAHADFFVAGLSLDGDMALLDDDGAAFMVHAQADDYMSSDSAGDRVACGVIQASAM